MKWLVLLIYVSKLWYLKLKYTASNFKPWKEKVLAKMKQKITELKQKIKPKETKPELSDPDVKKHLDKLHRKFVIFTIGKASNNFSFICRKYCISKLLTEVSPNDKTKSQHIHKHKRLWRNSLKLTWNTAQNLTLK